MSPASIDGLPMPVGLIFALAFASFPLVWCLVIWLVSRMGWRRMADAFPATSDPPLSAEKVPFASLRIGDTVRSTNYGSSIHGWLSESGLWLRPILLFRFFHPLIFIPWARVQSVSEERFFMATHTRVKLAADVPVLLLSGRLGRAVQERMARK